MSILITGGGGFIGSHLANYLYSENDDEDIIAIDRKIKYYNPNITYYMRDIIYDDLHNIFNYGIDTIYHLAAWSSVRESDSHPSKLYMDNVVATAKLLEYAKEYSVSNIVFASSGAVSEINSHYANSKNTCEHMLRIFTDHTGIHTVSMRFANVYGAGQDPCHGTLIANHIEHYMRGLSPKVYGGQHTRDYIYVGDLVELIYGFRNVDPIITLATGKVYNTLTVADTVRLLCGGYGMAIPQYEVLGANPGDRLDGAMDPTGYKFTTLEEGIRKQIEWRMNMVGNWEYTHCMDGGIVFLEWDSDGHVIPNLSGSSKPHSVIANGVVNG